MVIIRTSAVAVSIQAVSPESSTASCARAPEVASSVAAPPIRPTALPRPRPIPSATAA